jgi:hypothetical protein
MKPSKRSFSRLSLIKPSSNSRKKIKRRTKKPRKNLLMWSFKRIKKLIHFSISKLRLEEATSHPERKLLFASAVLF